MPVTLQAPVSGETIQILSATDVVLEVQTKGMWPKFHANYLAKLADAGKFPAPWITLGGRHGWLQQDVNTWIGERTEGQKAKRDDEVLALYQGLSDKELDAEFARLKKKLKGQ